MKPITQQTVLEFLGTQTKSWNDLVYGFVLDEERQYQRLERTLEKLHQQRKIEVIKEQPSLLDIAFCDPSKRAGSMFRFYKFKGGV